MRRAAFITVISLLLVALSAGVVDAARPAASFTARANHAQQGGHMQVRAKVKHAVRGSTFSATAVVHFASGDVTVEMTRNGKSFNSRAKVDVPADQPVGPVAVDVTVTYNGVPTVVTTEGTVMPPDDGDDDGDDDTE
jgi:hypothetical protein